MSKLLIACAHAIFLTVVVNRLDAQSNPIKAPVPYDLKMVESGGQTYACAKKKTKGLFLAGVLKKGRKAEKFLFYDTLILDHKTKMTKRGLANNAVQKAKLKKLKQEQKAINRICNSTAPNENIVPNESTPRPLEFDIEPEAINVSPTSLTVAFTTSQETTGVVEYAENHDDGHFTVEDKNFLKSHSVVLGGLTPGTVYHVKIMVKNQAGTMLEGHLHGKTFIEEKELLKTHHETIPNYAYLADTVSIKNGNWSDSSIWSNGVPDATKDVQINHLVTISGNSQAAAEDINVHGKLRFDPEGNTKLTVGTLAVPGLLEIGTSFAPVSGSVEVVFRDTPMDTKFDPEQFGTGLIVLDGSFKSFGRRNSAFIRTASAPMAGDTTITLSQPPVEWRSGDQIFLPDSRRNPAPSPTSRFLQAEFLTIKSVNGKIVELTTPIKFSHLGAADFLPHVAHLSSNITFRSENPSGTRGHVAISGHAEVDVHDTLFKDLGRTSEEHLDSTHLGPNREIRHVGTNQIGRYAFHMHHVNPHAKSGIDHLFDFSDNVIYSAKKWGVVLHSTSYGLISNNVIVDVAGAGLATEDGSEVGNTIQDNFIGLIHGSGDGITTREMGFDPTLVGDGSPENPFRTNGDHGHEGAGIWARGIMNHYVGNVVANARFAVLFWSRFQASEKIPAFKGADPDKDFKIVGFGQQLGHSFTGFEAYGSRIGLELLGLGEEDPKGFMASDLKIWNVGEAIDASYTPFIDLIGGQFAGGEFEAIHVGHVSRVDVDNFSITDFASGALIPVSSTVKNSYFHNRQGDIVVYHKGNGLNQSETLIENPKFGDSSNNIIFRVNDTFLNRTYLIPKDVIVKSYNGVAGDDFQLWAREQAPDYIMPVATPQSTITMDKSRRLSPILNKTNQELWNSLRITMLGKLIPADAQSRTGIVGYVSAIQADRTGPVISDLKIAPGRNSVSVTFKTNEPATVQAEYNLGDIEIGRYTNLLPAQTQLKTEHEVLFTGLVPNKKYSYMVRAFDSMGNLGGIGNKSGGAIWHTAFFSTLP